MFKVLKSESKRKRLTVLSVYSIAIYFHCFHFSINLKILCLESSQSNLGVLLALFVEGKDTILILLRVLLERVNLVRWSSQSPYKIILSNTIKKKYLYLAELYD